MTPQPSMDQTIFEINEVRKSYLQPDGINRIEVLRGVSLQIRCSTIIAVTGASGSGKSTLLHLMGGLDSPDQGSILVEGRDLLTFSRSERELYRNSKVGFVFQFHYMMPELNVLENVAFPALLKSFNKDTAYSAARKLLADVELTDKEQYLPYQLSGGERQRAAIARALINSPEILLADEPTGNLDWQTGQKVFNLFRQLLKERQLTAVIVTHNEELAALSDERYHLHEGVLMPNHEHL